MARAAPPRAEDHRVQAGDRANLHDRLEKALAVGVVADQFTVPDDHAVHSTDRLRGRREPVEELDDGDFVRNRAIEPAPVHRAGTANSVAELIRTHLDRQVPPVEPEVGKGGLDHRLRGILSDREPEDSDQVLFE